MNKTCLVLEGGAMRGIYTAGVLDTLMQNNIKFDAIIGVSIINQIKKEEHIVII